jgi:transcriptional regulator GlxA family with amidase domain
MKITVLAYPGCLGAEIFGFCDSLLIAERMAAAFMGETKSLFDVRVTGVSGRSTTLAGGINVRFHRPHRKPDLLVVPGFDFLRIADLQPRLRTLGAQAALISRMFHRGIPVAAICVGAFMLGEAGVLDGRRVATAWLFAAELARLYPAAVVEPEAMFVEDSGIISTGAFSSGYDLAVHLLRKHGRDQIARMISRMTFLDAQRKSQAAFADAGLLERSKGAFSDAVKQWLLQRLSKRYRLNPLARAFNVSARTLLRRFGAECAESPLSYLRRMRIEAAKKMLVSTKLSVATITERAGYEDTSTFVRMFNRRVGHTPARYRQRFREV